MYKDMAVMEARGIGGGGGFEEEGLFEYHLYTLGRRTHLRDKEQKQIELLSNEGVTAEKKYEFDHQKNHEKIRTTLEIENSEKAGLGMPLPGGIIRAFKADSSGQLQFVGEDRIDHTPKDDDFDVFLGLSFDITAERKVMDSRPITSIIGRGGETQQVQVEILNSKDEDIVVTVVETLWGRSAEVTHPNVRKEDANTFEIDVPVPAGKKVKVSYGTKMMY